MNRFVLAAILVLLTGCYFSDAALNSSAVFLSTCPSFSINAMVDSSLVVSVSKVITMFSAAIPSLAPWLSLLSFGTPQRG